MMISAVGPYCSVLLGRCGVDMGRISSCCSNWLGQHGVDSERLSQVVDNVDAGVTVVGLSGVVSLPLSAVLAWARIVSSGAAVKAVVFSCCCYAVVGTALVLVGDTALSWVGNLGPVRNVLLKIAGTQTFNKLHNTLKARKVYNFVREFGYEILWLVAVALSAPLLSRAFLCSFHVSYIVSFVSVISGVLLLGLYWIME